MTAKSKEKTPVVGDKQMADAEKVADAGTPYARSHFQNSVDKYFQGKIDRNPDKYTAAALKTMYDFFRGDAKDQQATIQSKLNGTYGNTPEERKSNQQEQQNKAQQAKNKLKDLKGSSTSNWADVGDALKAMQAYMEYMKESGQMSDDVFSRTKALFKGCLNNDYVQASAMPLKFMYEAGKNLREARREAVKGNPGDENPTVDPKKGKEVDEAMRDLDNLEEGVQKLAKKEGVNLDAPETTADTELGKGKAETHDVDEDLSRSGPGMSSSG